MIRTRQLRFALAAFLAIQPALGLVCQLDCRPTERALEQSARGASNTGCHEEAVTGKAAGAAMIGVPAHSCEHFSAPAIAPLVEKLHRSATSVAAQVAAVAFLRQGAQRSIQPGETHAPPGQSARPTDVLRV